MNNEELQARIAALHSVEDAYALAREGGFTGSVEEFLALGDKLTRMDLDDMDSIAGGSVDGVLDWCKENTDLLIGAAGSVAAVAATAVIAYKLGVHNGFKPYSKA